MIKRLWEIFDGYMDQADGSGGGTSGKATDDGGGTSGGEKGGKGGAGETDVDLEKLDELDLSTLDGDQAKAVLAKVLPDRRKKNAAVLSQREELDKLRAENEEFRKTEAERKKAEEDASISKLEGDEKAQALVAKATQERDQARAEALAAQEDAAKAIRLVDIAQAGIDVSYREIVEPMLREALKKNPSLDKAEWFEDLKTSKPALFVTNGDSASKEDIEGNGAAGGPSRSGGSETNRAAKAKEVEDEIERRRNAGTLTMGVEAELRAKRNKILLGIGTP